MIPDSEGNHAEETDLVVEAVDEAHRAAEGGDLASAIAAQERAVALSRDEGEDDESRVTRSILLYNLSSLYAAAERFDDAVQTLEQVVALDEQTGHEDLDADRQILEQMRQVAALSPEEREALRMQGAELQDSDGLRRLQAQINALPPEERAAVDEATQQLSQQLEQMSYEEHVALDIQMQRARMALLADQTRDAALAALRGEFARENLLPQIDHYAAQAADGQPEDSEWAQVAAFLRAVAAHLRDEPALPVPAAYAGHMAAITNETQA